MQISREKKNAQKNEANHGSSHKGSINRFWGNATRLEHRNVRNKNKGKKG